MFLFFNFFFFRQVHLVPFLLPHSILCCHVLVFFFFFLLAGTYDIQTKQNIGDNRIDDTYLKGAGSCLRKKKKRINKLKFLKRCERKSTETGSGDGLGTGKSEERNTNS